MNIYVGGNTLTIELKKGDVLKVVTDCAGNPTYIQNGTGIGSYNCSLSGHMVSSFTEGKVVEKEAVVFRGGISANQTVTSGTWTKVNLDTVYVDSDGNKIGKDSDLVDGKFKPSIAGFYQVNGNVAQGSQTPNQAVQTIASVYRNGTAVSIGSNTKATGGHSYVSTISDVIYLDPNNKWTDTDGNEQVGDYLELWGIVTTPTAVVDKRINNTFLSAHLITGQSSGGGDSVWTEVGNTVTYEKNHTMSVGDTWRPHLATNLNDIQFGNYDISYNGIELKSKVTSGICFTNNDTTREGMISYNHDTNHLGFTVEGAEKFKIEDTRVTNKTGTFKNEGMYQNHVDSTASRSALKLYNPNGNIGTIRTQASNVYFDGLVTTFSQVENLESTFAEVDKKLAIKDKIIEKLEARLTKLEARIK